MEMLRSGCSSSSRNTSASFFRKSASSIIHSPWRSSPVDRRNDIARRRICSGRRRQQRRRRLRIRIDRDAAPAQRDRLADRRARVDCERVEVRQPSLDIAVGREMPAIAAQPEPTYALPELALALLAGAPYPAITHRAVEYGAEEGHLVIEQAFHGMQRREVHDEAAEAQADQPCIHVHESAIRRARTP